jgi:hypothetical protein
MLGFAPNALSCVSVTTYFYVYLAGDLTWIMPLGEVCYRELPCLVITSSAQIHRRTFDDSSSSHARGLAQQGTQHVFGSLSSAQARGLGRLLLGTSPLGSTSSIAQGLAANNYLMWLRLTRLISSRAGRRKTTRKKTYAKTSLYYRGVK